MERESKPKKDAISEHNKYTLDFLSLGKILYYVISYITKYYIISHRVL